MKNVHIIGAGLSGLSAAITLAEQGIGCNLFSLQASERAQSVLAEGGINAALGEDDTIEEHFKDTVNGGCALADPNAVFGLTSTAPSIVKRLAAFGVPFNRDDGKIRQRFFGGQKKRRTAFAKSSTGKMLVSALIDEARKYESEGLIERFTEHAFCSLMRDEKGCRGVRILDLYTGEIKEYPGVVLLAAGGMNGMFPEWTTGTTQNNAYVISEVFSEGVEVANLEMIQYHPTTIGIPGKRCLISEAARGEGGRLYVEKSGKKVYFMEEKYPELGNLMPRDVVSREMHNVSADGAQVYLDLTGLDETVWDKRLPDLRDEIIYYMGLDPKTDPVPVEPGVHYFMGGIYVNEKHETSMPGLYASGEMACQYHGANRLGGNSLLGAIYGGKRAAEEIASVIRNGINNPKCETDTKLYNKSDEKADHRDTAYCPEIEDFIRVTPLQIRMGSVLRSGLGIIRDRQGIEAAMEELSQLSDKECSKADRCRLLLAEAMLISAEARKESRGAHFRSDYTESSEQYRKTTVARYRDGKIEISFRDIPERRV